MATATSIEKYLEHKFVDWCKQHKILAVKGPATSYIGIPDRIVVLPNGGGTIWVEFKGGSYYQLTKMQTMWKAALVNSDPERYFCINSKEQLEELMNHCLTMIK